MGYDAEYQKAIEKQLRWKKVSAWASCCSFIGFLVFIAGCFLMLFPFLFAK